MESAISAAAVRPVAIKIDDDIKSRMKRLADAHHRTSNWLMRDAITQYVEREEKREAFRQHPLNAWEEYRTTGRYLTADEADSWLVQLELGNDAEQSAIPAGAGPGQPLGDSRFVKTIEAVTGCRREVRPRGRPRKAVVDREEQVQFDRKL